MSGNVKLTKRSDSLGMVEIFCEQQLGRQNIPCKLTPCLDYNCDDDELKCNAELIKKHTMALKNIGHAESCGVLLHDRKISSALLQSPRQLASQLKSSKDNCAEENYIYLTRVQMERLVSTLILH